MRNIVLKLVTDTASNSITYSKNYRIFRLAQPVEKLVDIAAITDFIELNGNNANDLTRKFRWSRDGQNWSLWINFSDAPSVIGGEIDRVYFEFKYTYDNDTYAALAQPVVIEEVQLAAVSNTDVPETAIAQLTASPGKFQSVWSRFCNRYC